MTTSIAFSAAYPALDIQNRAASIAMPTVPTVFIPDTVAVQSGGMGYNAATGVMTVPETRVYTFFTSMNISTSGQRSIYGYAEVDIGAGFVISRYSSRQVAISAAIDGQVLFVSRNLFPAGAKVRFVIWASAACNATSVDLPGTTAGTATVPAWRIMVAG